MWVGGKGGEVLFKGGGHTFFRLQEEVMEQETKKEGRGDEKKNY